MVYIAKRPNAEVGIVPENSFEDIIATVAPAEFENGYKEPHVKKMSRKKDQNHDKISKNSKKKELVKELKHFLKIINSGKWTRFKQENADQLYKVRKNIVFLENSKKF